MLDSMGKKAHLVNENLQGVVTIQQHRICVVISLLMGTTAHFAGFCQQPGTAG